MGTWSHIVTGISNSKDAIVAVVATIGAIVSVLGIQTWRRQLKGRTEYELARRLLHGTYKVRDAIQYVRTPFMSPAELSKSMDQGKQGTESFKESHQKAVAAAYQKRWIKIQDAMSELSVETLEAEVLWGRKVNDVLKSLRQCVTELLVNLEDHLWYEQGDRDAVELKDLPKIRKVVFRGRDDPDKDKFTAKIQSAVSAVENLTKPFLKI